MKEIRLREYVVAPFSFFPFLFPSSSPPFSFSLFSSFSSHFLCALSLRLIVESVEIGLQLPAIDGEVSYTSMRC